MLTCRHLTHFGLFVLSSISLETLLVASGTRGIVSPTSKCFSLLCRQTDNENVMRPGLCGRHSNWVRSTASAVPGTRIIPANGQVISFFWPSLLRVFLFLYCFPLFIPSYFHFSLYFLHFLPLLLRVSVLTSYLSDFASILSPFFPIRLYFVFISVC
jgi:hypothetical protein